MLWYTIITNTSNTIQMKKILIALSLCFMFTGCNLFQTKTDENNVFVDTSNPTFTVGSSTSPTSVPLPQDEDVIRNLFALINEDKVSEAVLSMHPDIISEETAKQTWGVNFNTIDTATVKSIVESDRTNWPTGVHIYEVVVSTQLKNGAQYMGWDDGDNIKWISIKQDGNFWKVSEIATGP